MPRSPPPPSLRPSRSRFLCLASRTSTSTTLGATSLGLDVYAGVISVREMDAGVLLSYRQDDRGRASGGPVDRQRGEYCSAEWEACGCALDAAGDGEGPVWGGELVSENVSKGAKVIEVAASEGVLSKLDYLDEHEFSDEELAVIVEAERVRRHVHGKKGIMAALKAGCKTIEHETRLDEQAVQRIRGKDAILVATS